MEENRSAKSFDSIVLEQSTMVLLDQQWSKHSHYTLEDRAAFLKAVRDASLAPENGIPPTYKMYKAIFYILRNGGSLELYLGSYQLLIELDKRYPQVYLSGSSSGRPELVVVEEAWSPFGESSYAGTGSKGAAEIKSSGLIDFAGFHQLVQDLAEVADKKGPAASNTKFLGNMLLFQYLVNILEGDLLPRDSLYREPADWILVRESALNKLLGSKRVNFKHFVADCMSLACSMHRRIKEGFSDYSSNSESSKEKLSSNCDNIAAAFAIALPEFEESTCAAIQKLLILIIELDVSKKGADAEGYITRADGIRTPLMEIILDQLTYDKSLLFPFLQVFEEPRRKLAIVLQIFWKYIAKPSIRTRRSSPSTDDTTFNGLLECFSNITSTTSIIKKLGTEVVQLLLAHALEAHLALSSESSCKEDVSSPLKEICKKMISVVKILREADANMEILPFVKEALFTATCILSNKNK